jgi:hypothetical protein
MRQREWEWFQLRDGIIREDVQGAYREVIGLHLGIERTRRGWRSVGRVGFNPEFVAMVDDFLKDRPTISYFDDILDFDRPDPEDAAASRYTPTPHVGTIYQISYFALIAPSSIGLMETPLAILIAGIGIYLLTFNRREAPASGYVGAYDPTTGREIWRVTYGEGYSVTPRPVFAHGLISICTGYNRANILAIDPAGARGDVTATNVRWQSNRSVPLTPSVLVVGDELYFVSDNGVATCVDARTGTQHWSERLGGAFSASPVFAGGNVYFLSEEGITSVVKTGKTYEPVASNDLGERALASPAIDDGVIFLRTQSHLWRVGN